jgi:hypothetical protein
MALRVICVLKTTIVTNFLKSFFILHGSLVRPQKERSHKKRKTTKEAASAHDASPITGGTHWTFETLGQDFDTKCSQSISLER